MFVAQILICSVLNSGCVLLEDTRGVSMTKVQCVIRQEQMYADISSNMPFFSLVDRNCRKSKFRPA